MEGASTPQAPWRDARTWVGGAALVLLACALFTLAGSLLLLWQHPTLSAAGLDLPSSALALRVALFSALAVASGGVAAACARKTRPDAVEPIDTARPWRRTDVLGAGLALVLPALLVLPHLEVYPWAAPDEVHHLTVAKNLALHTRYASGSESAGFRDFDPFDSVGPTVIGPVAAVMAVAGVDLGAARLPMAAFYLALCAAAFAFAHGRHGLAAGISAPLLLTGAFGSIYLGRTLYGEVPAFLCFLLGLMAWRRATAGPWGAAWALAAGLALGAAVLCKSIFLLCAFPFAAVVWWDWWGPRRLAWHNPLLVAAGTLAPLLAWHFVQRAAGGDPVEGGGSTLGLYAHYLLFGLSPAPANLAYFLAQPGASLVAALWLVAPLPRLMRREGDPAALVLWLTGLFFLYWWIFFTPGQLPRYLWFTYAASALLGAGWLAEAWLPRLRGKQAGPALAGLGLMLAPSLAWTTGQAREVHGNTEMRHDLALAAQVRALPPDLRIATDFYPLRGTLRLLADREAALWTPGLPADLLISLEGTAHPPPWGRSEVQPAPGRYCVWIPPNPKAAE